MRCLIAALSLLVAVPAAAWEVTYDPVCTLTSPAGDVVLTYDPSGPLYAIALARPGGWPSGPVFSIRFEGRRSLTIATDRHRFGPEGRVIAQDSGFGNVLNGLQYNDRAVAILGEAELSVPLLGPRPAAPAVAEFRSCVQSPPIPLG